MLPANLQSLTPEEQIELFEVSGYYLPDPTQTFRFCNYQNVRYRITPTATPYEYQAIGCESDGYEIAGQGPIAQPTVTLSNIGRIVSDWLFDLKYNPQYRLEGSTVTRRITQRRFLEGGGSELEPAREISVEIFQIENIAEETCKAVQFVLSSPYDLDGATLPNRPLLRSCPWRYRDPDECAYTGSAMYTRSNAPTSDPSQDICNKSLAACELRFGTGNILRFGGFPGLGGL